MRLRQSAGWRRMIAGLPAPVREQRVKRPPAGIVAGAALVIGMTPQPVLAPPMTPIFDWNIRVYYEPFPDYIIPVPHVNYGEALSAYDDILDAPTEYPLALALREETAPGCTEPCFDETLAAVMYYLEHNANPPTPLSYVIGNFETESTHDALIASMVGPIQISAFHDEALMGNYADYPGAYDYTPTYPPPGWYLGQPTRTAAHNFYIGSGLNIAMPRCYPYEAYWTHTYTDDTYPYINWPEGAPNERSALFWAPLEMYSVALRALPSGHKLIPWINGFVPECPSQDDPPPQDCDEWFDHADPPTRADMKALLMHMRLRGAHGYHTLDAGLEGAPEPYTYGFEQYRADMYGAWTKLDTTFASGTVTVLNQETDKDSGLQWSGAQRSTRVTVLVSNLGNEAGRATLPSISGLPAQTCLVYPGTHVLIMYNTANGGSTWERIYYDVGCPEDVNGDELVDLTDWTLVATTPVVTTDCLNPECFCNPLDVNQDGEVDTDDEDLIWDKILTSTKPGDYVICR